MEKRPPRVKSTFLNLLPRLAASPVIFLNPPVSPVGDRRFESNTVKIKAMKGYCGPVVSMVPPEARRKSRNGSFDMREPTSPKVSCIGHIHCKKNKRTNNNNNKIKLVLPPTEKPKKSNKIPFSIHKIFRISNHRRKSADIGHDKQAGRPAPAPAPSLSQMKRFASGRDAFMNLDWRVLGAAVAPHGNCSSDGKEDGQEKAVIPFSGHIELEPKKAIDLWKRRAVPPPPPLHLIKK